MRAPDAFRLRFMQLPHELHFRSSPSDQQAQASLEHFLLGSVLTAMAMDDSKDPA